MNILYRSCVIAARTLLTVGGNYRVFHKERLNDWKRCIIAANHISYFDPPFIGSVMPREINYLAKSELFKVPLFGAFIRKLNAIPVKRGVVDRNTLADIKELLGKDNSILIFPEGSRKSFTAKPGIGILVYEMKVPILPVYIENSNDLFNCLLRKKRVNIYIGSRIDPEEFTDLPADKKTYRQIAEKVLARIKSLPHED